ncbi:MAG: tetratricopeptide repeat protein [Firmicutes bacterium]|nr:tetratricopeptide repeat protein [Bacillota bacterium]
MPDFHFTTHRSKLYHYLGVGIICLLLVFLLFGGDKTPSSGLSDVQPPPKTEFWRTKAEEAKARLQVDPNNKDYLFQLGISQAMLGEIEASIQTFQTIDRLDQEGTYAQEVIARYAGDPKYSENLLVQSYLAFAYYVQEDYPASVEAFDRVIRLDPGNPWPLNYQGFSLYQCGRLDKAVQTLEKSVRLDESNQYSHMLLGMAYYEQGHLFKALAELAKARGVIGKFLK